MRVPTEVLMGMKSNGRFPQNVAKVNFQEILPLRLKNRVSGKADSTSEVECLQEMSVLFSCLKDNEFSEKFCGKEIANFQKCYKVSMDKKFKAKQEENLGIITPGKSLNYKQLNKYMRKYPNPE